MAILIDLLMLIGGIAVLVTIGASLLLFIFTFMSKNSNLTKSKGGLFIMLYLVYVAWMLWGGDE
ncbi:MAG: hypothetical protein IMY74_03605 [Bacteroidetes bacterium]|nr:hypothetical protein [Bacteroidota bacterium]